MQGHDLGHVRPWPLIIHHTCIRMTCTECWGRHNKIFCKLGWRKKFNYFWFSQPTSLISIPLGCVQMPSSAQAAPNLPILYQKLEEAMITPVICSERKPMPGATHHVETFSSHPNQSHQSHWSLVPSTGNPPGIAGCLWGKNEQNRYSVGQYE